MVFKKGCDGRSDEGTDIWKQNKWFLQTISMKNDFKPLPVNNRAVLITIFLHRNQTTSSTNNFGEI